MFIPLDLIVPGHHHRHEPVRRVLKPIQERVETLHVIKQPADSIGTDEVTDTLNQAQAIAANGGGDDATLILWAVVAVLFVLAMCLYFVYAYRRRLSPTV